MIFQEKCFFYILLTDKFHFMFAFTSWDIGQYVYCQFASQVLNGINFGTNLIFLTKPVFYMTKKSRQKFEYLENEKNF